MRTLLKLDMYDLRAIPTFKHARLACVAFLWALYPVSGLAQLGKDSASMYYTVAGGEIKVITQGVGVSYVPAPVAAPAGALGPRVGGGAVVLQPGPGGVVARTAATLPYGKNSGVVVDVVAKIPRSSVAAAIAKFAKNVLPVVTVGYSVWELAKDLGFIPSRAPDGSLELSRLTQGNGYEYSLSTGTCGGFNSGWQSSAGSACGAWRSKCAGWDPAKTWTVSVVGTDPNYSCQMYIFGNPSYVGSMTNRAIVNATTSPATLADLEQSIATGTTTGSDNLVKAAADAIAAGNPVALDTPTVTGPASASGPKTTTTNSDGTTTVKQDSTNFTYNDNRVTVTNSSVTSTTNPTTNTTTTTTQTTQAPEPERETDLCKTNPDIAACRKDEYDIPDVEIPKENVNVTYQAEDLGFGGGTCPSDVMFTPRGGSPLKIFDWAGACSKIVTYAKPMILALATFAALMIIFGGGRPEGSAV